MADYRFPNARSWLSGNLDGAGFSKEGTFLRKASIREGLSHLTETEILIYSDRDDVDLGEIVGRTVNVHLMDQADKERVYSGICTSAQLIGFSRGYHNYIVETRPWFWLLTRTQDCRIYQEKSTPDIIAEVFKDNGFSNFKKELSGSYKPRNYCVQYRETDHDFLCRLMEEEGIYFRFECTANKQDMILCDSYSSHGAVPGHAEIDYRKKGEATLGKDHISEWCKTESLSSGKMVLSDYDFMQPTSDLQVNVAALKTKHAHAEFEVFDYPGGFRIEDDFGAAKAQGDQFAKTRMEAREVARAMFHGTSNVRALAAGQLFKLKDHEVDTLNIEYLATRATHFLQEVTFLTSETSALEAAALALDFPEDMAQDGYGCQMSAIPSEVQYRARPLTRWPTIPGLHTATVVGKSGEDIWTDDQGRIKVQFHWDRYGKSDEKSSCWVRVVTPWSGDGWGMVALPRIGQEVAVQFEEGNPDRPICTGMLYNNAPKHPAYDYPDDQTQLGIRTRSSKRGSAKSGGASEFHELMFDDKKGEELMRVQAQKDHLELIKNRSVVTIGLDKHEMAESKGGTNLSIKQDVKDGSLWEVIKKNVTRIINEGDHEFTIKKGDEKLKLETGSQTLDIKKDKTQTIEGKHTKTITGNDATTVKTGDMTIDVKTGKVTMKALKSIELKVGQSSIKLEPTKITMKSMNIDAKADLKADFSGLMTNIKASAILVLKGALTKIN